MNHSSLQSQANRSQEFCLINLDPSFDDLIPVFVEESCKNLDLMHAALERKDNQAIAKIVHKLKGSAASYCCTAFVKILEEIEHSLKADLKKDISSDLFQIESWKNSLRKILQ